jgi:SulP family sulfate permease
MREVEYHDDHEETLKLTTRGSRHNVSYPQRVREALQWCLPVLEWLPQLGRPGGGVQNDIIGGLVIGVMLVPTSLSWAALAQIPLQSGLAAALFGSFAYGMCGQCAALSIGPVAEVTTLLISIQSIAVADRQATFQSIGVQVGFASVVMSWLGGGNIIRTIFAKPVADGYTTAAAVLVVITQAKLMLNVPAPTSTSIQDACYTTAVSTYNNFGIKNVYAFLLFLLYTGYLLGVKKTSCPTWVPHQLIIVVVSTLITWRFGLDQAIGLKIVQDLPSGIPSMATPDFQNFIGLAPYTATVTIVAFLQNYCIARKLLPSIDPDRELFASGMANLLSCLFGGMPVASSLARSGVLLDRGVKTPLTSFLAGLIMLLTMTLFTRIGAFYYLPLHALTAIIVSGLIKLCDFTEATHLYRVSFMDFCVWATTFALTLVSGITVGVLAGIALSLILVILRVARPRVAAVGYEPEKLLFTDLRDDPELLVYPNILVWRFDGPLYFVSIGYFEERLKQAVRAELRNIDVVIVYCSKISDIDSAAVSNLPIIVRGIESMDPNHPRKVLLAQVHGRIEPALQRCSLNKPARKKKNLTALGAREASLNDLSMTVVGPLAGTFLDSEQVFFRSIAEAVTFAQRYVDELHAARRAKLLVSPTTQPDECESTAPKPHVSFLVQAVMDAEKELVMGAEQRSPQSTHTRDAADGGASHRVGKLRQASLFHSGKELIGIIGIVRHAERTPKQKLKLCLALTVALADALKRVPLDTNGLVTAQFHAAFCGVLRDEKLLSPGDKGVAERAATVIEEAPDGIEVKVKRSIKENTVSLVVKWGGTLSPGGTLQARQLGRELVARFFAAGDLPLEAMSLFTSNVEAFSPREERLVQTAAVMMQALTGRDAFRDITIDDALLSDMTPAAKALMRRAELQFSAIMHVRTVAGASHCLHIPGLRELLRLAVPHLPGPGLGPGSAAMLGGPRLFGPADLFVERPLPEHPRLSDGEPLLPHEASTSLQPGHEMPFSADSRPGVPSSAATTPYDVVRYVGELLRIVSAEATDISSTEKASIFLHQRESLAEFIQRWRTHSRSYWRKANSEFSEKENSEAKSSSQAAYGLSCDEFDLSNINRLVDDVKFDNVHNIEHLHKASSTYFPQLIPVVSSLRELDRLLSGVAAVATSMLRGSNRSERFILGAHVCQKLFAKIERDVEKLTRADISRATYEMHGHAQRLYVASKTTTNVEAMLVVQDKMIGSLRRRIANATPHGKQREQSPFLLASNADDPGIERFQAHKRELNLFELFPEPSRAADEDVCTRFYFAPQSHASTAQGCLFDSNSIKGFVHRDETQEILHYMTHVIFKVFRCRRPSLSDAEYHDLLLGLPLVTDRSMTEAEQDAALREALHEVYCQRYYTLVEVFMSTGAEDQQCGSESCGLRPMIRVHPGIRPSQLAALNREIAATIQSVPD